MDEKISPKESTEDNLLDKDLRGLLQAASSYLSESALAKQRSRLKLEEKEKRESQTSRWKKFWSWWKDYGTSAATLVTILSALIGGLWTFNQYLVQEREKIEQQQREAEQQRLVLAAQFAEQLSDPVKRNTAAYALATFSGEEAIPILISELVETASVEDDPGYLRALSSALISIGEISLEPILDVNRQAADDLSLYEENQKVLLAVQPVILHFMKTNPTYIREHNIDFSGVRLPNVLFTNVNLSNLDLSNIRFSGGTFCSANLENMVLQGASFFDVGMMSVSLRGANIQTASFSGTNLSGAVLIGVEAQNSDFGSLGSYSLVDLSSAEMSDGNFSDADFSHANLGYAQMEKAIFINAVFTSSSLFHASLLNTDLSFANFIEADLEYADFTDANLMGVKFFDNLNSTPYLSERLLLGDEPFPIGNGAFVREANFEGAQNVDDDLRIYLCKWGAVNVPGGCADVQVELLNFELKRGRTFGGGSCW